MRSLRDRPLAWLRATTAGLALCLLAMSHTQASAEQRALKLFNIHTKETATVVFKRDGVYDQAGLRRLHQFLRDWRKEEPTNMGPQLFDLVWEVYRRSGSRDYIHVVSAYRSPATNGMLRRRSPGVAKNSLHMSGNAMDFYIPDVKLATLREIGLKMQLGGVGFYPASGAPFVHLDTGSVRHWPRMSRQQLVQVFPNGGTLHVPSDGKPLPGYSRAQAAYKARKASGVGVAVASFTTPAAPRAGNSEPLIVASIATAAGNVAPPATAPRRAVAVANYSTAPTPTPRLAPRRAAPVALAAAVEPITPAPAGAADLATIATVAAATNIPDVDFGPPRNWFAPAVPAALAEAMAERDLTRRGASLPIPPTAVVTTIDVSRPLRAAVITTAVLRGSGEAVSRVPRVLAYAAISAFQANPPRPAALDAARVPLPQPNPLRTVATSRPAPATRSITPKRRMDAPALTMTALDTQGLRLWIGPGSTRQKGYALLTMPDFSQSPNLIDKPEVSFGAGFGRTAYSGLRTDRFAGPTVVQPSIVDLRLRPPIATAR